MKKVFLIVVVALALIGCDSKKGAFLEEVATNKDLPTAVKDFEKLLKENKLTHFATIDHTQNAKNAKLRLHPETVVIFGNPKMGTPLMQCNPSIGLDLPIKMLFTTDYEGKTYLTYTNPEYWTLKHNIKDKKCLEIIRKMHIALQNLADTTAKP